MGYSLAAINIGQSLQRLLDNVVRIVPKLIVFVIILIIGWIVAKVIERAVAAILERMHFNRVAERGVVGNALRRSDYDASRLIARLFFYAVLLLTLQMAFNVFGPNPISDLLRAIVAWLPRLAVAVIIVVIASAIAHAVKELMTAALGAVTYGRFLADAVAAFIIVLGVIAALNQIGIATTVTEPVLITALATIGAILAIGVGGGLIKPMQQRWERILSAGERDAATVRSSAYQRGREDAMRGEGVPTEDRPGERRAREMPGSSQDRPTSPRDMPS
ncbi:MAG: mechanosensitive ion channel family protein [Actinoallomurus sp.]